MMRQNSYLWLREVEQNLIMTEACGATNCTMMEVGGAISSMMKVCGATKSTLNEEAEYKREGNLPNFRDFSSLATATNLVLPLYMPKNSLNFFYNT